ncbi:MAG: hypothetical protein KJP06_08280, partial [Deltaproteobacteria bacterium]|nr:hypothetical protein [Deltaproteobacteria bacterium]
MTEKDLSASSIPSVSIVFEGQRINLLDRLRHWPKYEPTRDERSSEIDCWVAEVLKRSERGAAR